VDDQAADEIGVVCGVIQKHVEVTTCDQELSTREVELGSTDQLQEILVRAGKASESGLNCSDRRFKHQSGVENSIFTPPFVVEDDVGEVCKAKTSLKEIKLHLGDDGRPVPSEVLGVGEEELNVGRTFNIGVSLSGVDCSEISGQIAKGFLGTNDHDREGVRCKIESLIEVAPLIASVLENICLG
jgi:hypothetical protein